MDKQNLLTIGNLSKQTGVHIKSLRYYEQLGILRPAHTDPDTGYRYYTLSQIPVVDAIRACTFLHIPLKEFTSFLTEDQQRIHYKKLISHGTMLAHQKIRDIQEKLHLLEKFQKQMDRMEGLRRHEGQTVHALPEKYCWTAPYAGKQHSTDYNVLITNMFDDRKMMHNQSHRVTFLEAGTMAQRQLAQMAKGVTACQLLCGWLVIVTRFR